jgi:prepilin-type N-terminal cleavage/methylation domain-containing protein
LKFLFNVARLVLCSFDRRLDMHKKISGFTLVELMVVVGIMGVLALIGGITIISTRPAYQLQKAAHEMAASFRKARTMAIKLNRPVALSFYANTNGDQYAVDNRNALDNSWLPAYSSTSKTMGAYYGAGVQLGFPGRSDSVHFNVGSATGADAGDTIVFNTRGLTETTAGTAGVVGYVYIQNSRGQGYRVGVTGLAANIKIDQCRSQGVASAVDCTTNP